MLFRKERELHPEELGDLEGDAQYIVELVQSVESGQTAPDAAQNRINIIKDRAVRFGTEKKLNELIRQKLSDFS